jgi:hypothetical protein
LPMAQTNKGCYQLFTTSMYTIGRIHLHSPDD